MVVLGYRSGLGRQATRPVQVDCLRVDIQHVPGAGAPQQVVPGSRIGLAQHPPQPRHVGIQHIAGVAWQLVAPHPGQQLIDLDRLPWRRCQRGQHAPLSRSSKRNLTPGTP
jgi:hypothetical protein